MLWNGQTRVQCSIPGSSYRFFSSPKHPDQLWGPPSLLISVRGSLSRGKVNSTWSWQLTPTLCQVKSYTSTINIFLHGRHRDTLIILIRNIHNCVCTNMLWLYDWYLYSCLHGLGQGQLWIFHLHSTTLLINSMLMRLHGLEGQGIKFQGGETFCTHPDQQWGTHTTSFPGVKQPAHKIDHPPPPSTEVKERVQLYIYFPHGLSRPVLEWNIYLMLHANLPAPLMAQNVLA